MRLGDGLIPIPGRIRRLGGVLRFGSAVPVECRPAHDPRLRAIVAAARRVLAEASLRAAGSNVGGGVFVGRAGAARLTRREQRPVVRMVLTGDANAHPQAYRLRIDGRGVALSAGQAEGLWYAVQTLRQLADARHGVLPRVAIDDRPDFAVRGFMLDISRDKVPTMRTLRRLVDRLAALKFNQLQLYTEHTFAYRRHRVVWRGASPLTAGQVRALDRYCRARFIELVPNQNCFGHMERWLRHRRYRRLAECSGPWRDPWGRTRQTPATLNPRDPRALALVRGLLDELLPNFTSRQVNVGCDETFELGQGRSAAACRRMGSGRVYLDYLLALHRHVRRGGRRMQFWADIIHQHPRLIRRLPRDAIALEWGYEADHPFGRRCAALAAAGLEFYVCPGTSSWCSFAGRSDNARANICAAAGAGRRHGARGLLLTDWGDGGHRQPLAASYVPIAQAAAAAWCARTARRLDVARAASRSLMDDAGGPGGRLWQELGAVHEHCGVRVRNQSVLYWAMQAPFAELAAAQGARSGAQRRREDGPGRPAGWLYPGQSPRIAEAALRRAHGAAERVCRRAARWQPRTPEARLCKAELLWTAEVLLHACRRIDAARRIAAGARRGGGETAAIIHGLIQHLRRIVRGQRRLWLARNRRGGLGDSLAHFERLEGEYRALLR